jgi:hypothetical protein
MSEEIKTLQQAEDWLGGPEPKDIKQLQARIKELEEALKDLANWAEQVDDDGEGKDDWIFLNRAKQLLNP